MLKKLVAMLVASAFAISAFAQAPKSDTAPKAQAGTEAPQLQDALRMLDALLRMYGGEAVKGRP